MSLYNFIVVQLLLKKTQVLYDCVMLKCRTGVVNEVEVKNTKV